MLDLAGTELVVLSACETGLGENRAGEGVFGLRRAFQESGAQSVLMSMWLVPDPETRRLMEKFYRYWLSDKYKDKDKYDALRRAQFDLREELKKEGQGHEIPYYWGAFVLVGR
jgi:CHAT domain-containing protein